MIWATVMYGYSSLSSATYPTRRRIRMPDEESPGVRPKTRASPLSGRNNPIRVFIVVVFPAPLRPRKPKILPAGTLRLSPASAACPLNDFRRPCVSITNSSMFFSRLHACPHLSYLVFEKPAYLVLGKAKVREFFNRGLDDVLRLPCHSGTSAYRLADVGSGAVPEFDDPFVLEFAICAHNRVRVHHEILG